MPNWSVVKPKITATLDGQTIECVKFAVTYELNAIPAAQLDVAVGRNMANGRPAAIHTLNALFRTTKPKVQVHLKLEVGNQSQTINWGAPAKNDGALIFEGYATHSAPSLARGQAQVRIPLQHWLNDLDKASAISGASHPGNPADFVYPSVFKVQQVSGVGAKLVENTAGWIAVSEIEEQVSTTQLETTGMWDLLKTWMTQVSQQDPVDPRLAASKGNPKALAALSRMPTTVSTALDLANVNDGTSIGHGILQFIRTSMTRNNVNTTLWGKLVGEWCPAFFLAVVPRVSDALVVPFTGPLAGAPENYITITSKEYDSISAEVAAANSISAVGIYYSAVGGMGENGIPYSATRNELAAVFPKAAETGMVLMKDSPVWLSNHRQPKLYTGTATGIRERKPIRTALGGRGQEDNSFSQKQDQDAKDYDTMLARFAQQWYAVEKTKDRIIEVRTRLRFDVSPGTQVLIKGSREDFIANDALAVGYYGIVIRVSHSIGQQAVFTTLTIGYLRTAEENNSELYSVVKPPLYKEGYYGAPLIPG